MQIRLDLDPTLQKVICIAILIFAENFITAVLVLLQEGEMPTELQLLTVFLMAMLQLVTFIATFLRTGEVPEDE